jgi:2-phospho-L-lactate guanylyltransferase
MGSAGQCPLHSAAIDSVGDVAVLVPVKAFHRAKLRLAPALDGDERARLARAMATHVLECARDMSTAVVCDDVAVRSWAQDHDARVVWAPGLGLDRAVETAVADLSALGANRVIVVHADLPLARDFRSLGAFAGVTLVPDRREDGTNVVCVPAKAAFRFSYGAGSFARHASEARRLRLPLRVVREPLLAHDVDVPADLVG